MDKGNPVSSGGIEAALLLCEVLQIPFEPDKPRKVYNRGWEHEGIDPKPVIFSWTLSIEDMNDKTVDLTFDLVDDDSPLTIGLDVKKYRVTNYQQQPPVLSVKRPTDTEPREFEIYITEEGTLNQRSRIAIVPSVKALLNTRVGKCRPKTLAKRLHRLTHGHPDEIVELCQRAGYDSAELQNEVKRISENCSVCARSRMPVPSKKISITHVNEAFNVEIQIDFVFCSIRNTKYIVLHMIDAGTGYSEAVITQDREAKTIIQVLESEWLHRHGRPDALSADDEMNSKAVKEFLHNQGVSYKARPVRRHNKTGIVERKKGVVKRILEKLQFENTSGSDRLLLFRAIFFSNCFSGSKVMSSFELAKGYAPAILGAPRKVVTEELLTAYKEQSATRAIHRLLKSNDHSKIPQSAIKPGDDILFFFRTTAQNQPDVWKQRKVVQPHQHLVEVRTSDKAPISKIGYEDIRLRPNSELAREFSEGLMEDYIHLTLSPRDTTDPGKDAVADAMMISQEKAELLQAERAQKEIGSYASPLQNNPNIDMQCSLESNEQNVLKQLQGVISWRQVTRREMQFAPPWILKKDIEKEHDDNWVHAYTEVEERDVPKTANIISSHTVYKVKEDEEHQLKLKARLVTHGNRDELKDEIRKDCSNADMLVVRMLLSIALCLGFVFGVADVKGAYLQSGPITREIFVRPPPEFSKRKGILWKLTKLPYGIVEAGRKWAKRIETWMLGQAGLKRVFGVNQLFLKRDTTGRIMLIIAKLVDDLLVAGSITRIEKFIADLQKEFEVGKIRIGDKISFAGCDILQDDDTNLTLSIYPTMTRIHPNPLFRARKRVRNEKPTE